MPIFNYRIEATDEIIEVTHTTALTPKNWGELCLLANIAPDDIPSTSLVTQLLAIAGIDPCKIKKTQALPCIQSRRCPNGGCN